MMMKGGGIKMSNKLFDYGKIYLSDDKGNISGPFVSTIEASLYAEDTDTVLIAVAPSNARKHKKEKVTSLIVDFNKNVVVVEGAKVTLNKVEYAVGTTEIDKEELKEWSSIVEDAYKEFQNTIVVGNPPVVGEDLNALLHL